MQNNKGEFTPAEIAEFIGIWARAFDELITQDRALLGMRLLLELYLAMADPLPGEDGYSLLE